MGKPWSGKEDAILSEYASLGVNKCVALLAEESGYKRSKAAVIKRASRLGVSLYKHAACPACGRIVRKLTQQGLCSLCNARMNAYVGREEIIKQTKLTKEEKNALDQARKDAATKRSKQRYKRLH